jgi:hypothetical protein
MEGHNSWCANRPGSTLLIPVGDLAQHMIAVLCFMVQNGFALYDDINGETIAGLERFGDLVDLDEPLPLSFMETYAITECTAELSTCCYAGMLMLQAMGLEGWMFDGIDRYTVLGASGDPEVPGLGFRYDTDERWPLPNPTGLEGSSRATARHTTPTCGPPSRPSPSGSSAPVGPSIPTRRAPGRRAPGCAEAQRSTARSSRSAWRFKRSISTTASVSSPAQSPACSCSPICRPTTWTWSSTTTTSGRERTCRPMQTTRLAGIQKGARGKEPTSSQAHTEEDRA